MKKITLANSGVALLAGMFVVSPASAYEELVDELGKTGKGMIGLAVGSQPDYEGSDQTEGTVGPFGRYNWASGRFISLGGAGNAEHAARLKMNALTKDTAWELGPVLQYRMKRDDVDRRAVDKMKEVDGAVEAGAYLGWHADRLTLSTTFATDVSDEHDGSLWYFNAAYSIPVNDSFTMAVGGHMTWASDDYMDTYFGVSPNNSARSGLKKYTASSGIKDAGMSVMGHYMFNQNWGMLGYVNWTRLLNDAEDSPLVNKVGDENQVKVFVGATYSF